MCKEVFNAINAINHKITLNAWSYTLLRNPRPHVDHLQSRFERETAELQRKQQWYQQNQVSMLKEDEDEYLSYCAEAMFRIHILELRLNR